MDTIGNLSPEGYFHKATNGMFNQKASTYINYGYDGFNVKPGKGIREQIEDSETHRQEDFDKMLLKTSAFYNKNNLKKVAEALNKANIGEEFVSNGEMLIYKKGRWVVEDIPKEKTNKIKLSFGE